MANEIPISDTDLITWGRGFSTNVPAHIAELGLDPAQVAAMVADYEAFKDALQANRSAQAAALSATATKDAAKDAFIAKCRRLVRQVRGHEVPDGLLEQIGIGSIEKPTLLHPEPPENLVVLPNANGTNVLRWKPGGNKKRTVYMVEVMNAKTQGWQYLTATTKCSFRHEYQLPGFAQTYRVRAVRGGKTGIPSFTFTVYGAAGIGAEMAA